MNRSDAPLVTVVIPVYNAAAYLAESVASALGQSYPHLEVVVVDDGSSDDSLEVAASLAKDPRVRVFATGNRGPSHARNLGIMKARGDCIAFLDADDVWMPHKLERQVAMLAAHPELDVVYSQRLPVDAQGRPVGGFQPKVLSGWILEELYVDNPVCMSSALVRRRVFSAIGLFDESLRMSEDFEFWLRTALYFQFLGIEEPLVRYRIHGGQVSRRIDERVRVAWEIRARFEKEHGPVSLRTRRRARAHSFCTRGYRAERAGERWDGLRNYVRALALRPFDPVAVRGVLKCVLPGRVLTFFRKAESRAGGGLI